MTRAPILFGLVFCAAFAQVQSAEIRLSPHYGECFKRQDMACALDELDKQTRRLEQVLVASRTVKRTIVDREQAERAQRQWTAAHRLSCRWIAQTEGGNNPEFALVDCLVGHTAIRVDELVDQLRARREDAMR